MGPAGSDWTKARLIGFNKAMAENPGLKVVGSADGGYLRDKGLSAAQDLLTRNKDVNAIYGENEDMALGASQAVDAAGLKQWDGSQGVVIVEERRDLTALYPFGTYEARLLASGLRFAGGELELAVWGRNLTDEEYPVFAIDNTPQADRSVLWGEPRTLGLDLTYRYL